MIQLQDGPLAGASFTVPRCPQVVRCVRDAEGKADILNLPEDEPTEQEEVFWYRWDGKPAGHVCFRRPRRCYALVTLVHAPLENFPAPREDDCAYGCCKAGDVGLFSAAVA